MLSFISFVLFEEVPQMVDLALLEVHKQECHLLNLLEFIKYEELEENMALGVRNDFPVKPYFEHSNSADEEFGFFSYRVDSIYKNINAKETGRGCFTILHKATPTLTHK